MKILAQFAICCFVADAVITTTLAIVAPKVALALQAHILQMVHP